MYPKSIYFGLKVVHKKVVWGQSLYYLSTWTLWETSINNNQNMILGRVIEELLLGNFVYCRMAEYPAACYRIS